jgi:hypothetical protein
MEADKVHKDVCNLRHNHTELLSAAHQNPRGAWADSADRIIKKDDAARTHFNAFANVLLIMIGCGLRQENQRRCRNTRPPNTGGSMAVFNPKESFTVAARLTGFHTRFREESK